jgi:hypothetical protein
MITAVLKIKKPDALTLELYQEKVSAIAGGFQTIPGLIRKNFLFSAEEGVAGGIYTWESLEAAKACYSGPWLVIISATCSTLTLKSSITIRQSLLITRLGILRSRQLLLKLLTQRGDKFYLNLPKEWRRIQKPNALPIVYKPNRRPSKGHSKDKLAEKIYRTIKVTLTPSTRSLSETARRTSVGR